MNQNLESYIHFKLLSSNPLITFSSYSPKAIPLFELIKLHPGLFKDRKGLHLLAATWDMELSNLENHQNQFKLMRSQYPNHQFIIAAATETEAFRFSKHHMDNLVCNHSIFQDENIWKPTDESIPHLPYSDAIYVARLINFKRHHLCTSLKSPLFAYSVHNNASWNNNYTHVKELCPDAIFVNHFLGGEEPILLDEKELNIVMGHAKVSLCLSKIEGTMRSSIQSLLCGLPVVSTHCIGGRERYYSNDVAMYVEDTPQAVQAGVKQMIQRGLNKQEIRNSVLKQLLFDRNNVMHALNKIARHHFKNDRIQINTKDLTGIKSRRKSIHKVIQSLNS